jgi:hypothetical protein
MLNLTANYCPLSGSTADDCGAFSLASAEASAATTSSSSSDTTLQTEAIRSWFFLS